MIKIKFKYALINVLQLPLWRYPLVKTLIRWIVPAPIQETLYRMNYAYRRDRLYRDLYSAWESKEENLSLVDDFQPSRDQIVSILISWGLDAEQIEAGSIPESDLRAIWNHIRETNSPPIIGIHVGNFVGVSLAYIATRLKCLDEDSMVIAIDPNLPHRGVQNPDRVVTRLLRLLKVQGCVLRLTGYSLYKSLSNDGQSYDGKYDPYRNFEIEEAAEWQLRNLLPILRRRVNFIMLDGNHQADYLRQEIEIALELLKESGAIYLDDIAEGWPELVEVFNQLSTQGEINAQRIGTRTGCLTKLQKTCEEHKGGK